MQASLGSRWRVLSETIERLYVAFCYCVQTSVMQVNREGKGDCSKSDLLEIGWCPMSLALILPLVTLTLYPEPCIKTSHSSLPLGLPCYIAFEKKQKKTVVDWGDVCLYDLWCVPTPLLKCTLEPSSINHVLKSSFPGEMKASGQSADFIAHGQVARVPSCLFDGLLRERLWHAPCLSPVFLIQLQGSLNAIWSTSTEWNQWQ